MSQTAASNKLVWQSDTQDPEKSEAVKAALREVVDPEIGLNIIELGLVRDLGFNDDKTSWIKMILTTPFCPYGPAMLEQETTAIFVSASYDCAVDALGSFVLFQKGREDLVQSCVKEIKETVA